MRKTVVINVVGLTERLIGTHTPSIARFRERARSSVIKPVLPAVTCTAQSTYLTGKLPGEHGVVGNGWYFKDECEVKFWRQSNKLVQSPKIWDVLKARHPDFTCANMFWWYNMYSTVDYAVTPRPNYLADGRKIPDIYSHPAELRDHLQKELGTFPLFNFWGPKTSVVSSEWIARSAILTDRRHDPTLTLIYLPHLDYNLQRHGHDFTKIATDLNEIDEVVGALLTYYEGRDTEVVLLSEYGITDVDRPVHLNRVLRRAGHLAIRTERGLELLDAGASAAFAVADHQVAHIYLNDASIKPEVERLLSEAPGVEQILSGEDRAAVGLDHDRAGDLIVIADNRSWFTYYFWLDDAVAPDYARMVDIHKKPGYDPVEMFTDPADKLVAPKIVGKLVSKKLGFRTVMDVIPLKAELVRGSHGRVPEDRLDWPVFISSAAVETPDEVAAEDVMDLLVKTVD